MVRKREKVWWEHTYVCRTHTKLFAESKENEEKCHIIKWQVKWVTIILMTTKDNASSKEYIIVYNNSLLSFQMIFPLIIIHITEEEKKMLILISMWTEKITKQKKFDNLF